MKKRYCSNCIDETLQSLELFDPDNSNDIKVWVCSICNENIDIENLDLKNEKKGN